MSLLTATNIEKFYGLLGVLKGVSFRVEHGDRIGLVGPNGEGKTTLLKVITGLEETSGGQFARMRGLRIGYLSQQPPAVSDGDTPHSLVSQAFQEVRAMEREMARLEGRMAGEGDDVAAAMKRYGELQVRYESAGGYSCENRILGALRAVGFAEAQYHQSARTLSGGQLTRALLAKTLLERPDLLVLDEPTNHLDMAGIAWLERCLQTWNGALIVVSHDRYFLNKVTNRIWEVRFGTLETYRGNYTSYVEQRVHRELERERVYEAQQKYIATTEEFVRRFIAGQRSKEAQGRRTILEKFKEREAIEKPRERQAINIDLTPEQRGGDIVLRTADLVVGFDKDNPLALVPDLEVRRGARVAVAGDNGCGKTTLIRTLLGEQAPLEGVVKPGGGIRTGYLSQRLEILDRENTALETLVEAAGVDQIEAMRGLLARFRITGEDVFKPIGCLSGGQQARVALALLTLEGANCLVLDEPTNHLDVPSQEELDRVLKEYGGTILFVSHDRYLIQSLATEIWHIEDGILNVVRGGWAEWIAVQEASPDEAPAPVPASRKRARA